jgi:L-threonylcarbamoyladenylate synthase
MPRHPVARKLIELVGVPVAAPSANSFGRTSPTRAEFVLQDLDGRIDAVVDSGDATLGLESTVVDVCEDPPILYRPGMLTLQQLQSRCPGIVAFRERDDDSAAPQASPGLGLKHYSPRARLLLVENFEPVEILAHAAKLKNAGETVGLMLISAWEGDLPYHNYVWGDLQDQDQLARRLFAGLRELDAAGATVILCPLPEDRGLGVALRDRLFKAAR